MTIEQNQPQTMAPLAQAQPVPGQSQGQGHRRRRRRRKGFANGQNKGLPNEGGQPAPVKHSAKSKSNQNRFAAKNGNGHGNGGAGMQGGGRRKGKPRRQQTFVGPMDHSYRAVNGNLADSPPSTIELRGNAMHRADERPRAAADHSHAKFA